MAPKKPKVKKSIKRRVKKKLIKPAKGPLDVENLRSPTTRKSSTLTSSGDFIKDAWFLQLGSNVESRDDANEKSALGSSVTEESVSGVIKNLWRSQGL